MKIIRLIFVVLGILILCTPIVHAQNSRWDYTATTTVATYPAATFPPLLAIPGAQISFYTGCAQLPCSTFANSYSSLLGTIACPTTSQVVPSQTGVCTSTTDNQGNFGGFFTPGQYEWVITLPSNGQQLGPFAFSVGNPAPVATLCQQNANNVRITGGAINNVNISGGTITGAAGIPTIPVSIPHGGTGPIGGHSALNS